MQPPKNYKLVKLDVQGAEQQADSKYKVVGEVFITVRFEKEETPKPPTPSAVEDTALSTVVLAPNPFADQLGIASNELQGEYVLLNSNGVVCRSGRIENRRTIIDTYALPVGLYLLRITSNTGANKTFRVVKN